MLISVVIPVRNRPELVARCVRAVWTSAAHAVQSGALAEGEAEVVVVDNGSTDDTAAAAATAGARVVLEPQPNRCRARNAGAAAAAGTWIAFLDSDCEPAPHWLAELASAFLAADRAAAADPPPREPIFAGAVISGPPGNHVERYFDVREWFDQRRYLNPPASLRFLRPFALTANLSMRRAHFLASGGFDAGLPFPGEDADWCWRACEAGAEMVWLPRAGVLHNHRATWRGLWHQSIDWGRGQSDLLAKWGDPSGAGNRVVLRYLRWALGAVARGVLNLPLVWPRGDAFRRQWTFDRALPWLDAVANAGLAYGRLRGGVRSGLLHRSR